MTDPAGPQPAASVEALKRLKEMETEWDAKLVRAREETARRLAKAREAAEAERSNDSANRSVVAWKWSAP